jgi:hypothetical protein
MNEPAVQHEEESRGSPSSALARMTRIVLVVFGLIVALFVIVVWLGGDQTTLPFNYDGFN